MTKDEAIKAVESADISDARWIDAVIDNISCGFARGYLSAKAEELGNAIDSNTEEYREEILEIMDYDIWEK